MSLVVNTNVSSLSAQRHLGNNTKALSRSFERLSSGFRINRAGDDAAGLQVSENLRTQIRGAQKALDNVQDGMNMLNIADGAYQAIVNNIQRGRELAVQAANDTYDLTQRTAITQEVVALYSDSLRIANSTQFNGVQLLDGTVVSMTLQIGPNDVAANDTLDIASALGDPNLITGLVLASGLTAIVDHGTAQQAITAADVFLGILNDLRGNLGAFVNRLESAQENLSVAIENLSSSESRIRNTDIAAESAAMTQAQILQQSAATVLSQANQSPALALQLIGG